MQFLNNLVSFLFLDDEISLDHIMSRRRESEVSSTVYDVLDRVLFGEPINLEHYVNEIRDNGFVLTDQENSPYNFLHDDEEY
ncbi:Hypothetical protein BRZCDTV_125 [Brazilian cedratvirus IHUMI]|uniref:Uncharacterized protein n=1 Tax=Brazilian cedratvirus IHUMI TaxID=2126980 RepID=A0A2R8FDE7_9VIRU|nr:Hypothetical protein BRZCDTV_125 [Brazilian cedratvirus IHUMI]